MGEGGAATAAVFRGDGVAATGRADAAAGCGAKPKACDLGRTGAMDSSKV